jgi:hypothetical protein
MEVGNWRVKRPTNEEVLKSTEPHVLDKMVELRAMGWSYIKITSWLHVNKYPCPYKGWTTVTVTGILKAYGHPIRSAKKYYIREHVEYAKALRASGMTYQKIADTLNAEGKFNIKGDLFTLGTARSYIIYDQAVKARLGDNLKPYSSSLEEE